MKLAVVVLLVFGAAWVCAGEMMVDGVAYSIRIEPNSTFTYQFEITPADIAWATAGVDLESYYYWNAAQYSNVYLSLAVVDLTTNSSRTIPAGTPGFRRVGFLSSGGCLGGCVLEVTIHPVCDNAVCTFPLLVDFWTRIIPHGQTMHVYGTHHPPLIRLVENHWSAGLLANDNVTFAFTPAAAGSLAVTKRIHTMAQAAALPCPNVTLAGRLLLTANETTWTQDVDSASHAFEANTTYVVAKPVEPEAKLFQVCLGTCPAPNYVPSPPAPPSISSPVSDDASHIALSFAFVALCSFLALVM